MNYETEKGALLSARKCTKSIWRAGSARTRWGTYSPLAGFKGQGHRQGKKGKDSKGD